MMDCADDCAGMTCSSLLPQAAKLAKTSSNEYNSSAEETDTSESSDGLFMMSTPTVETTSSTAPAPLGLPPSPASSVPSTPAECPQRQRHKGMKTSSLPATHPVCPNALSINDNGRFMPTKLASRQSGKVGVIWNAQKESWVAAYTVAGKRTRQYFSIQRFRTTGVSWKAADKLALNAAQRVRQDALEKKGAKSLKKRNIPQSGIFGVYWHTAARAWKIELCRKPVDGNQKPKRIFGGNFYPKENTDAARNEALHKAKEALVKLLEEHKIQYVQAKFTRKRRRS